MAAAPIASSRRSRSGSPAGRNEPQVTRGSGAAKMRGCAYSIYFFGAFLDVLAEKVSMTDNAPAMPGGPVEDEEPDLARRRMLTTTTVAFGAVGVALAAVPFIESLEPSEKAKALGSPVTIDISKLAPGEMMSAEWRQRPVWILHRTEEQLAELPKLNGQLKDPQSKEEQQPPNLAGWNPVSRSINPKYLVVVGICTHLGCIPKYRPQLNAAGPPPGWPGGFFCRCQGSGYDRAGGVMDDSPAPPSLPVPPYYFKDANTIVAGQIADGSDENWEPDTW